MSGVWVISSGRVNVESSDDSTWESGGATTPVDPPDGKRGQDVQDVLPDKGGTAAVSRGRVTGTLATRMEMWVHFVHQYVQGTVVILEEGNSPTHGVPGVT